MSVSAGTRFGPYQIASALGAGGMGEVYKARDTRLDRDVAVKVLPASFAGDPDRLRRFEQEARAAAALNHPNILAVYDVGTHDGRPYIVSELLAGTTLREALAEGALPVSRAIDIARQIASGLAAAHAKGITHRDIKPENLFLVSDGRVKILDLGLAKLREETGGRNGPTRLPAATELGVVLGTVSYMSPEQVRGQAVDARSDIFSVGVVLFEMLAGTRPFHGDSSVETMSAILKADAPDLSADTYKLPPALDRVVRHCLEKNPDERFQSAQDLAFALQSSLTSSSTASAAMAAVGRSTSAGAPRDRRERVAWAVATVFCLSTLVLAAFAYRRSTPAATVGPVARAAIQVPAGARVGRLINPGLGPSPLALSPDGRYLAFVASVGTTPYLWLRPLESLTASRIGGTDGAIGPFWSPDSRSIAFFANGKLKRVGVAAGEPQTLCETDGLGGGTWSQDDVILLSPAIGGESGMVRVPASGGAISSVTQLDPAHAETNHVWPHFLPDGHHFLYNIIGRDNAGIYVGSLDSGDRTQLLAFNLTDPDDVGLTTLAYAAPGYVLYVRGQTLMAQPIDLGHFRLSGPAVPVAEGVEKIGPGSAAFSVSNTGALAYWSGTGVQTSQLTWRARDGTVMSSIGDPGGYASVALAPDERRIAVSRVDPGKQSAIWVLDVTRGTSMKVSFDPVSIEPVWSPDSTSLVYGSARDGPPSLIQKAVTGAGQDVLLLKSDHGNVPTDWCAGGRTIVFQAGSAKTRSDVWILPLTGDRKPIAVLQTPSNESFARCSPDGRWLAYISDESGRDEVYVTSFPTPGGKWPISRGGGAQPQWRRDGTELFYVAPDRTVMAVRVGAGSTFEAGAVAPLFKIRGSSYAATADGRRFLTDDPIGEPASQPITVVLNWTAGMKH
jgi:Tol biopolymer transport system component